MFSIRCKFKCVSITRSLSAKKDPKTGVYGPAPLDTANFQVVIGDSEENKKFFASTPSGELKVGMHEPGVFEVGMEYYIDITPAE